MKSPCCTKSYEPHEPSTRCWHCLEGEGSGVRGESLQTPPLTPRAVARSPDRATKPTEGLPKQSETFGRPSGGVGRPRHSALGEALAQTAPSPPTPLPRGERGENHFANAAIRSRNAAF